MPPIIRYSEHPVLYWFSCANSIEDFVTEAARSKFPEVYTAASHVAALAGCYIDAGLPFNAAMTATIALPDARDVLAEGYPRHMAVLQCLVNHWQFGEAFKLWYDTTGRSLLGRSAA